MSAWLLMQVVAPSEMVMKIEAELSAIRGARIIVGWRWRLFVPTSNPGGMNAIQVPGH